MTTSDNPIAMPEHACAQCEAPLNHIKKVIGIVSAKGGVGKSFITGLIACEAARKGYQVGILDADLFAPSISQLFGVQGPAKAGQHSFLPLTSDSGIKIISPNLLMNDQNQPDYWDESEIGQLFGNLCLEVEWGSLDFLFIDLPPATSEAGFSIIQTLPFAGLIVVTQPQKLSATMVTKAIQTADKLGVNILGIVENMSSFLNPDTEEQQKIVEQTYADSLTNVAMAPIIAKIPLDPRATRLCDVGRLEDVKIEGSSDLFQATLESLEFLENLRYSNADQVIGSCASGNSTGSRFSDTVLELIRKEENMGVLEQPDAQGFFTGSCGDSMQIDLKVVDGTIQEARFIADGCGATVACGSMITKMACSKPLSQAREITSDELLLALDGLPEDHLHCAELAVMAMKEAIIDAIEGHRNRSA